MYHVYHPTSHRYVNSGLFSTSTLTNIPVLTNDLVWQAAPGGGCSNTERFRAVQLADRWPCRVAGAEEPERPPPPITAFYLYCRSRIRSRPVVVRRLRVRRRCLRFDGADVRRSWDRLFLTISSVDVVVPRVPVTQFL